MPVSPPPGTNAAADVRSHIIPSELVPERAGTVAFFGNQARQGDWLMPRLFRAVAALGSVKIDLTRARVGSGTSTIEVRAFMGNVEIHVPPGMRVDCDGTGLMGNFEAQTDAQVSVPLDAPLIRVRGVAFMANVEVKVIDPNAPGWLERVARRLSR